MRSIKEKAIEAQRNIHPLFESINDLTEEPVSVYDQDDMRNMFEQGANYVIEQICEIFDNNSSCEKVILEIGKLISQLKK